MKTSKLILAALVVVISSQSLAGPFLIRFTETHIYTRPTELHPWIATERVTGACRPISTCANVGLNPVKSFTDAGRLKSLLSQPDSVDTRLNTGTTLQPRVELNSPELIGIMSKHLKAERDAHAAQPERVYEFTQTPLLVDPKWAQRNLNKAVITEWPIFLGPVK